jgi:antitoxin component YwqK of YwqJK toxin-antitoxin module
MSVEDSGYVFYGVNGTRIAEWVFQPSGDIIKKGRVINGLVKVFYAPDLVAAEIYYKNNFRDGSYIRYFRDGKINTHGNYKHGEKYGSWKSFMPDGSVEQDAFYQKADNAEIYYKTKINPSYIYEPIWAYIDREDDPKSTAAAENKVQ